MKNEADVKIKIELSDQVVNIYQNDYNVKHYFQHKTLIYSIITMISSDHIKSVSHSPGVYLMLDSKSAEK